MMERKHPLFRAGWALVAAGGLSWTGSLLAQKSPYMPVGKPGKAQAAVQKSSKKALLAPAAQQARNRVELAWLADPVTFPHQLEARVLGTALEVRGSVPDYLVHERATVLAREHGGMRVIDRIDVYSGQSRMQVSKPSAVLQRDAERALGSSFSTRSKGMQVHIWTNVQVVLKGTVASEDEKLLASKCLKNVDGCSCVINQLNVKTQQPNGPKYQAVATRSQSGLPKSTNEKKQTATAQRSEPGRLLSLNSVSLASSESALKPVVPTAVSQVGHSEPVSPPPALQLDRPKPLPAAPVLEPVAAARISKIPQVAERTSAQPPVMGATVPTGALTASADTTTKEKPAPSMEQQPGHIVEPPRRLTELVQTKALPLPGIPPVQIQSKSEADKTEAANLGEIGSKSGSMAGGQAVDRMAGQPRPSETARTLPLRSAPAPVNGVMQIELPDEPASAVKPIASPQQEHAKPIVPVQYSRPAEAKVIAADPPQFAKHDINTPLQAAKQIRTVLLPEPIVAKPADGGVKAETPVPPPGLTTNPTALHTPAVEQIKTVSVPRPLAPEPVNGVVEIDVPNERPAPAAKNLVPRSQPGEQIKTVAVPKPLAPEPVNGVMEIEVPSEQPAPAAKDTMSRPLSGEQIKTVSIPEPFAPEPVNGVMEIEIPSVPTAPSSKYWDRRPQTTLQIGTATAAGPLAEPVIGVIHVELPGDSAAGVQTGGSTRPENVVNLQATYYPTKWRRLPEQAVSMPRYQPPVTAGKVTHGGMETQPPAPAPVPALTQPAIPVAAAPIGKSQSYSQPIGLDKPMPIPEESIIRKPVVVHTPLPLPTIQKPIDHGQPIVERSKPLTLPDPAPVPPVIKPVEHLQVVVDSKPPVAREAPLPLPPVVKPAPLPKPGVERIPELSRTQPRPVDIAIKPMNSTLPLVEPSKRVANPVAIVPAQPSNQAANAGTIRAVDAKAATAKVDGAYTTTGLAVFEAAEQPAATPAKPAAASVKPAAQSSPSRLQLKIARVCGKAVSDVEVTALGDARLLIRIKARNANEGDRLSTAVFQMPELEPYQVSLDIPIEE